MTRVLTEAAYEAHQARHGRGRAPAPIERTQPGLALEPPRSLKFRLPFPPSVNDLYGVNLKTGKKFLVPEQREYRDAVELIVGRQMRAARQGPLLGWLEMNLTLYLPDRIHRDGSNHVKAIEDALQKAGAFKNDYQIDDHHIHRDRFDLRGQAVVELREIAA